MICFIALVISKHIELSTGLSIRRFVDASRKIVDGQILNHITNKIAIVKAQPSDRMVEIIAKLFPPH